MTCLDPNSKLGRAIRAGRLSATKVVRRPGEDAADAFVRGMYERDPAGMAAWEDSLDAIIGRTNAPPS
jgi:hypothetical protein